MRPTHVRIGTAATGTTAIGTATGTTLGTTGHWAGGRSAMGRGLRFRGSLAVGLLAVLQPLLHGSDHRQRRNHRLLSADRGRSGALPPVAPRGADCRGPGEVLARCGPGGLRPGRLARPPWPKWTRPSGWCPTTPCRTSSAAWCSSRWGATGGGCRRPCGAVRRAGLGLDDAERPLSKRGCLHAAASRLEQYAKSRPAAAEAKFLLAYQYLTCGYADAAAAQLKEVVRLNPKDQLSAQLLKSISTSDPPSRRHRALRRRRQARSMRRASWAAGPRRVRTAPRSN